MPAFVGVPIKGGELERAEKTGWKGNASDGDLREDETHGNVENKNPMKTKKTLHILLT